MAQKSGETKLAVRTNQMPLFLFTSSLPLRRFFVAMSADLRQPMQALAILFCAAPLRTSILAEVPLAGELLFAYST